MSLPSAPGRGRKPPLPAGSYTTSVRTTVDGAREGMHALQQQYAATMSALREAAE